jgi:NAD(P)H-nitrite reductase large subunit
MSTPIRVDRCVCAGVTFAELLDLHRESGLGFRELVERTGASRSCGLCTPYIQATLDTGHTSHPLRRPESPTRR